MGLTRKEFGELLNLRHTVLQQRYSRSRRSRLKGGSIDFLAYYSLSRIVLVLGLSLSPVLRFDVAPRQPRSHPPQLMIVSTI